MFTKISKTFRWEMAHRLPFHEGGCKNIHGHSYAATIEIAGEPDAKTGMVLDYFDLGAICEPMIKEIDHAFLCDNSDTPVKTFLEQTKLKAVFVDFSTTAENIAAWMYARLSDELMVYKNLRTLRIVVSETERTTAEVAGELRLSSPESKLLEHQSHMLE